MLSLIKGSAVTVYFGGYRGSNRLTAAAVRKQKRVCVHIESVLVLPYLNREFDTTACDSTTFPPLEKVPPCYAIAKRNQWMVSESNVVISGVIHSWGGAAKTLDFARSKGKVIFQYPRQAEKQ